ncbi:unknown [Cercopithecine alphaherpesvirus 9]|uniref:Uncharacterized protein n=2 Tax=Cercopithecine alphaherpesvirus 9 TaxID=35246 RepID=A0A2D0TCK4_CHV9D|nr:protein V57 [Cercopithecine alphaherpesvirus 9]AAD41750.1 unknown [Cercopithecine alphaherpesvirus 9]AAG27232.1 unknown [Cercopithecine alphaherpesvirus 9]
MTSYSSNTSSSETMCVFGRAFIATPREHREFIETLAALGKSNAVVSAYIKGYRDREQHSARLHRRHKKHVTS